MSLSESQVLISLRDAGPANIDDLAARFGQLAIDALDPLIALQRRGYALFDKAHALGFVWRLTEAGALAAGKIATAPS